MKFLRPCLLALLITALVAPLAAQPKTPGIVKGVEPARVAYVNSSAFLDPTNGIKQLVKAVQGLELEFSSTQSELSLMGEKLRTIVGDLNKLNANATANAKAIADKQAEGQKLQQELQGKQQAAQEAFNKRSQEVQGPIGADIGKELHAFAKDRDLGLLLDAGKLADAILDAKPELDLTVDFVNYYNAKHP